MTRSAPPPYATSGQPAGCGLWLVRLVGMGVLGTLTVLGGMWWLWGRHLPDVAGLESLELAGQTRVYDRGGQLVGVLSPPEEGERALGRVSLTPGEISPSLRRAVVTSEDRRFYEHRGVDPIGVARGLFKGIFQRDLEGGSSITQQVVKNTLLSDLQGARTPERKFKEAILAYRIDRKFNKDQVLNAYLNLIYWGNGGQQDIVGADAAARAYFRKSASELNLAESVYLATLIPAPNGRYPAFEAYRPLMRSVLTRMVEDGQITQAQANTAWTTPIYPAGWRIGWNADGTVRSAKLENPRRLAENLKATARGGGYESRSYLQAVEKELLTKLSAAQVYGGGRVYTGMDLAAQQAAERASLNAQLPEGATLGFALVNPQNGEALALVGQKLTGGRPSDWNNAFQSRRQVGSAVKPFLYTLALSKGWKQSDTVLDSPLTGEYQPKNYSGTWTGQYVTMRYALDHSLNLPTARIGLEVGMPALEAKLKELGFTPPPDAGLSLSIGTLEASPLQVAAAYAPFANGGVYYPPTLVRQFQASSGRVLYRRPDPQGVTVWDKQTAWLGLDMIRGVVNDLASYQGGLASRAQIEGWEVGGKTGTTNDIKDLWFAGVTPLMSGAVWVGKQQGGTLPAWAYSGTVAAPIWQQAVSGALTGREVASFIPPAGIVYRDLWGLKSAFREADADAPPASHDGTRPAPAPEPQAASAPAQSARSGEPAPFWQINEDEPTTTTPTAPASVPAATSPATPVSPTAADPAAADPAPPAATTPDPAPAAAASPSTPATSADPAPAPATPATATSANPTPAEEPAFWQLNQDPPGAPARAQGDPFAQPPAEQVIPQVSEPPPPAP